MSAKSARWLGSTPLAKARILVMAISFLTAAFLVGGCVVLDFATVARLGRAIAEADRDDHGWRQAEIWARRTPVPDDQNSALRVQKVLDQLPKPWIGIGVPDDSPATRRLYQLVGRLSDRNPRERLADDDGRLLHDYLASLAPACASAIELARMPRGRYAVPSNFLYPQEPTEHAQNLRQVIRLLQYVAFDRIQSGDIDGALEAGCAIINAGRSIGDEPNLIPQLIRNSSDSVALITLQRALAQGNASAQLLSEVQECLAGECAEQTLILSMMGERATIFETFDRWASGDLRLLESTLDEKDKTPATSLVDSVVPKMLIRYNQALLLESLNRAVFIARRPSWEQTPLWRQLETARGSERPPPARWIGLFARLLEPATGAAGPSFLRTMAIDRVGMLMMASERFRLEKGRWPDTIDSLVPRFLAADSLDPFTGKSLVMKKQSDGILCYSLGSDGKDDGGNFDSRGRDLPGYDLGYRLWDEPAHGRPPER